MNTTLKLRRTPKGWTLGPFAIDRDGDRLVIRRFGQDLAHVGTLAEARDMIVGWNS